MGSVGWKGRERGSCRDGFDGGGSGWITVELAFLAEVYKLIVP